MNFPKILRGVTGEPELVRSLGALGVGVYIVAAHGFVIWNMARGVAFDITAYCLAFPGGLTTIIAGVGTAAGFKDKAVAQARATETQTTTGVTP